MSSYIVDDETINKVVSYLYAHANAPDWNISWDKTKLHAMGFDVRALRSCAELAQKMLDLNVAAVSERYGRGKVEKVQTHKFTPAPLVEVIKALKAWMYQCTEGDVPNLALYKAMEQMHCLLCIEFVEQTEEYEAAPWG